VIKEIRFFEKIGFLTEMRLKKSDPSVSSLRDDKLFGKIGFLTEMRLKKSDFLWDGAEEGAPISIGIETEQAIYEMLFASFSTGIDGLKELGCRVCPFCLEVYRGLLSRGAANIEPIPLFRQFLY
jgi:hypothetical protein